MLFLIWFRWKEKIRNRDLWVHRCVQGVCLFPGFWSGWSWLTSSGNSFLHLESQLFISNHLIWCHSLKAMGCAIVLSLSPQRVECLANETGPNDPLIAFFIQELRLPLAQAQLWGRVGKDKEWASFSSSDSLEVEIWKQEPCVVNAPYLSSQFLPAKKLGKPQ